MCPLLNREFVHAIFVVLHTYSVHIHIQFNKPPLYFLWQYIYFIVNGKLTGAKILWCMGKKFVSNRSGKSPKLSGRKNPQYVLCSFSLRPSHGKTCSEAVYQHHTFTERIQDNNLKKISHPPPSFPLTIST